MPQILDKLTRLHVWLVRLSCHVEIPFSKSCCHDFTSTWTVKFEAISTTMPAATVFSASLGKRFLQRARSLFHHHRVLRYPLVHVSHQRLILRSHQRPKAKYSHQRGNPRAAALTKEGNQAGLSPERPEALAKESHCISQKMSGPSGSHWNSIKFHPSPAEVPSGCGRSTSGMSSKASMASPSAASAALSSMVTMTSSPSRMAMTHGSLSFSSSMATKGCRSSWLTRSSFGASWISQSAQSGDSFVSMVRTRIPSSTERQVPWASRWEQSSKVGTQMQNTSSPDFGVKKCKTRTWAKTRFPGRRTEGSIAWPAHKRRSPRTSKRVCSHPSASKFPLSRMLCSSCLIGIWQLVGPCSSFQFDPHCAHCRTHVSSSDLWTHCIIIGIMFSSLSDLCIIGFIVSSLESCFHHCRTCVSSSDLCIIGLIVSSLE